MTANNFRGREIAVITHGVGEGEEDQHGGGCLSKFHSKAKIFKKKSSIPEAAVLGLEADACSSSCLFPSLLVCSKALYMPCPTLCLLAPGCHKN